MKLFSLFLGVIIILTTLATGQYVASAASPGSNLDTAGDNVQFLGFTDVLNKTTFGDFGVMELSGLTYDSQRGVYYAVADRAKEVKSHFFTLDIPVDAESLGTPTVLGVTTLSDAEGVPYNGYRFDAEGMAFAHPNRLFIASESGSQPGEQPEIRCFSLSGNETESLPVTSHFLIGTNNLSFESMAVSPNGRSLFTMNEGPLVDDGRTADLESRLRLIRYEDRGPDGFVPSGEYFYLTDAGRTKDDVGAVEIIVLSEDELLVLERGFVTGEGNTVRIFRVSLGGAMDISMEPSLDKSGLKPVTKQLVLDVADLPSAGAVSPQFQPNPILDNFETMALGPELPGGRRVVLLFSDDNGSATQVTRIIALAIPTRDLVGNEN